MKPNEINTSKSHFHKYNIMILSLVIIAAVIIVAVWMWYGHKGEQLEKEIYLLR